MLKTDFIPVAIDQAYQRRQQDTEGDFYRKIAGQGPRSDFEATTQGFYIATAAGDLLLYNNNRHPEKVRRLMRERLASFTAAKRKPTTPIAVEKTDPRYAVEPPDGGLIVRVRSKVLDGYEPTDDRWRKIFQSAISRDNLWISKGEHKALVRGEFPDSLSRRIARFHLVDSTRGEPTMWKSEETTMVQVELKKGRLAGEAVIESEDGERGYAAKLRGVIEVADGKVTKFDVVVLGDYWGAGRYTKRAPKGKFPLAVTFELADGSDVADGVPPQGIKGWIAGYINVD